MEQTKNKVFINGILAETDIKYSDYTNAQGTRVEAISGSVTILVETDKGNCQVPVRIYANKLKGDGTPNKLYLEFEKVKNEMVSIAAAGSKAGATKVRVSGASIQENAFYAESGQLVSTPVIRANFITEDTQNSNPQAFFDVDFVVENIAPVVDRDGIEVSPTILKVRAGLIGYGDKVNFVDFLAKDPAVVNGVSNWEVGSLQNMRGNIEFSSVEVQKLVNTGFEEVLKTFTNTTREFVINGTVPVEADYGFSPVAYNRTKEVRLTALENSKNKRQKAAPSPGASMNNFGF